MGLYAAVFDFWGFENYNHVWNLIANQNKQRLQETAAKSEREGKDPRAGRRGHGGWQAPVVSAMCSLTQT